MRFPVLSLAMILCLGPVAAQAQTWEDPRFHFGFGFHFSQPMSDLKTDTDSQPGFGFSLNMPMDYGRGHVLRPRWDITVHSIPAKRTLTEVRDSNLTNMTLGLDYQYYLSHNIRTGPYLVAGVGVDFWSRERDSSSYNGYGDWYDNRHLESSTSFCTSIGMGFQFSRGMAIEVRASQSQYRFTESLYATNSSNRTAVNVQTGLQFRW